MLELLDLYAKHKRGKTEPASIRATIESWGGNVLEDRQVSRLTNSPFTGLRIFPIVYEFRTDHNARCGFWLVRTSADGSPPDWAWLDLDDYDSLPIDHPNACVARNTVAVSWTADSFIVGGAILFGVVACIAIARALG